MGILSVILAAIGGFAIGAVCYMTFSKPWAAVAGLSLDENGRPVDGGSVVPFVIAFAASLLMAGMLRHVFAMAGIDTAAKGLVSGVGLGLFILAPWISMNYAYSMRPRNLTLIDGGYAIVGPAIVGLILGALA